jgi:hypothetical protein
MNSPMPASDFRQNKPGKKLNPVLLLMGSSVAWLSISASASEAIQIEAVQAKLFLAYSGQITHALSDKDALRNTITSGANVGGTNLKEPSEETLVDVVVRGKPGSFEPNWIVDLIVTNQESGAVVARFSQHVGVLSDQGRFHVAFLVQDTGCNPLGLSAHIRGTTSNAKSTVNFICRE